MKEYTVREIAELLSVSEETVRRWIRGNKLEADRSAGTQGTIVTESQLKRFLDNNKNLVRPAAGVAAGVGFLAGGSIGGVLSLALGAGLLSHLSKGDINSPQPEDQINKEAILVSLKLEIAQKELEIGQKESELKLLQSQAKIIEEIIEKGKST